MDLSYVAVPTKWDSAQICLLYNLVNLYCLGCSKVELLNDVYLIIVHMRLVKLNLTKNLSLLSAALY